MKRILLLLLACTMLSSCTGAIVGDYSDITVEETTAIHENETKKVEEATTSAKVNESKTETNVTKHPTETKAPVKTKKPTVGKKKKQEKEDDDFFVIEE